MSASRRVSRPATFNDVGKIVNLLREFYAEAGEVYKIAFDEDSACYLVDDAIRTGICLVGQSCCAAAFIAPFPFNTEALIAQVVFWYFRKHRELRIFLELCEVARAMGATHINAASLFPDNRVGRHYEKLGFVSAEKHWLTRI